MKRLNPFIVPAVALLFSSCMSSTHFNGGTALPEKRLPQDIKSIVIVNRTQPPFNLLNNLATGTLYGYTDRPGVPECLNSTYSGLIQSNFYKTMMAQKRLIVPQSASFPRHLWGIEVQNICKEYNADAVLSLEIFDVVSKFNFQPGTIKQMDATGKDYFMNILTATQETSVTAGWRVYNGNDTTIVDEYKTDRQLLWKADGINEENARSKLPLMQVEMPKVASEMGYSYVNRISPKTEIIYRRYYGRETPELKRAKAYIGVNNWDKAKQIWLEQANNNNNEIAGRAIYNLAIYYEKQRDIDAALELAQKACARFKNNNTTLYLEQLQRIKNQQK